MIICRRNVKPVDGDSVVVRLKGDTTIVGSIDFRATDYPMGEGFDIITVEDGEMEKWEYNNDYTYR